MGVHRNDGVLFMLFLMSFIHAAIAIVVVHPEPSGYGDGYDIRRAEEIAHGKALEIPGLCAVQAEESHDGSSSTYLCTGAYVYGRNGIGYVLTAAHCVTRENVGSIYLSFSPNIHEGQSIRVSRVHVHPQYSAVHLTNNIALLEFNLVDKALVSVPTDTEKAYAHRAFFEGWIAGYGAFSTNTSEVFSAARIHMGATWVQLRPGREGILQFSMKLPHGSNRFDVPIDSDRHFDTQLPAYQDAEEFLAFMSPHFKIHAEQSMCTPGDGGGPLFVKSQTNRMVLAGIASHSFHMPPLQLPHDKMFRSVGNMGACLFA